MAQGITVIRRCIVVVSSGTSSSLGLGDSATGLPAGQRRQGRLGVLPLRVLGRIRARREGGVADGGNEGVTAALRSPGIWYARCATGFRLLC